jgi:serine/threonine protein kinase
VGSLDGRTLGHFRVERLIGSGGMGAVYEAVDEKLERQVALKVLLREGDTSLSQKRFLREARLAAKLTHPNIATVFEVGEFESHLYIVMELLEGQSLRKLLASQRLSTPDALGVARDVARALARAHTSGIAHRDIKPENVFVTAPAPHVLHAKVLDFGLARQQKSKPQRAIRSEEDTTTETTAPGEMLGTPGYWSPEQARSGEVDLRTDIFSFGILLYEMLTGRQAFKANSTVALVLAVTRHEPEPMRKYVPNIDPALEKLVARCIAKDPAQRHTDGGVLLEEIEDVLRAMNRTSQLDVDDTASDAHGPPVKAAVAAAVALPRPRESAPGPAPTPGPTSRDHLPSVVPLAVAPERLRLFVAIGGGIAGAGLLLILVTMLWGGSGRAQKATAGASPPASVASSASAVAMAADPVAVPSAEEPVVELTAVAPAATPIAEPAVTMIPTPLAVAVTATPVAAVTAQAPAPVASHAAPARPRVDPKKADCAQPFTVDAKGVKIPKLHCL